MTSPAFPHSQPPLPLLPQTPQSILGKRNAPTPPALGCAQNLGDQDGRLTTDAGQQASQEGSGGDGCHGNEGQGEEKSEKRRRIEQPPAVSQEELNKVNKEVLGHCGSIADEEFFCTLCHTRLNSVLQLERHTIANEHLRRVNSLRMDKSLALHYCDVCHVSCSTDDIHKQHLSGRKHNKNVENYEYGKTLTVNILGGRLDQLLHKEVVAQGNGLSLGLSSSMTSFFSLKGPFIGLQYALESGTASDPNPIYHCTLCSVATDAHNFRLHFTSSAHRMNVLRKDYPERYTAALQVMDAGGTKGDFNNQLKDLATEIEAKEGKKIELIRRQILHDSPRKVKGRGRGSGRGGNQSMGSGRGRGSNQRGRGRGGTNAHWSTSQYDESGWSDDSYPDQGFVSDRGRGTFNRGRGSNSRGGRPDTQWRGHFSRGTPNRRNSGQDIWNTDSSDFQGFPGPNVRGRGNPRGRGAANHGRVNQQWEDEEYENYSAVWRGNRSRAGFSRPRGRAGFNQSRGSQGRAGFNRAKRSNGYNSELFGDFSGSSYNQPFTPPVSAPTVQYGQPPVIHQMPPPVGVTSPGPPQVVSPLSASWPAPPQPSQAGPSASPTLDPATLINNLAKSSIETEEDADAAFKISTALTQALLAYRLKSVAKDVESHPSALLAILGGLQGGGEGGGNKASN